MDVELLKDGEFLINGKPVEKSKLAAVLKPMLKSQEFLKERVHVLIDANSTVTYGTIVDLANEAYAAGAKDLMFINMVS